LPGAAGDGRLRIALGDGNDRSCAVRVQLSDADAAV
jgi:outer membrane usher protein FimD/PapC